MEQVKLDLGCGERPLPGYIGIDRKLGRECYPLSSQPGSVDEIRASHVLEHFSHRDVADVVGNWVQALKPGGVLKIAVPDFDKIVEHYAQTKKEGGAPPIEGWIVGGHSDENDIHGSIWTRDGLKRLMESLGMGEISEWESEQEDCAALPISLNLRGVKAGTPLPAEAVGEVPAETVAEAPIEVPIGFVKAVMTLPNISHTKTWMDVYRTLPELGISLETRGGVFWCQSLERLIEPHLDDGTGFVLTLDYDTLFNRKNVEDLIRIMIKNPHIDALCPVQVQRGVNGRPLFMIMNSVATAEKPQEVEVLWSDLAKETMQIRSGHFGLTLLRVSSLKKMKHPWFNAVPGPDGRWGDGRMDADISFWHQWGEVGNTLHLANHVNVGHIQWVASWLDRRFNTTHQFLDEYHEKGRPAAVAS